MAFLALLIAVVLIVAAVRGTHMTLFSALGQDVPGFAVWGAALFAVAVLGFIPGLKPVSRGLLALVLVVLVLTNYQAILNGFQSVGKASATPASGGAGGAAQSGGDILTGFDQYAQMLLNDNFGSSLAVT